MRLSANKTSKTRSFIKSLWCLFILLGANTYGSTLLVLGDSLSAGYGINQENGWVALLEKDLGDDHRIINGSISGDTTGGGLNRLPRLLACADVSVIPQKPGVTDIVLPSKLPNLMASARPVVAMAEPDTEPEQAEKRNQNRKQTFLLGNPKKNTTNPTIHPKSKNNIPHQPKREGGPLGPGGPPLFLAGGEVGMYCLISWTFAK